MKKLGLAFVVAATMGAGTIVMNTAQAAPASMASELSAAANGLNLVEQTQFVFEGREYCWYDDAWNGPGWYWCGYATRQGFGWGGAVGWHNWHHGGERHPVHGPGSSHNPIIRDPVHGPGSSHNPIVKHPVHGVGSSHNPIVTTCRPYAYCRHPR